VNGRDQSVYFARPTLRLIINQVFDVTDRRGQYDVIATVKGGGLSGQAGAVRHGISTALTRYEPTLRTAVKREGCTTRDPPVRAEPIAEDVFPPGVTLRGGAIVYDPDKLLYPGDLLHEAGHVAVTEPERRAALDGDAEDDPAEEMAAIAWSWAAAKAIGIDP